jgi:hypothetical protein
VVGKAVYSSGPKIGDLYQVRLADPTDETKMPVVGFVVRKPSATECIVQWSGELKDVFTGLTIGRYNAHEDGDIDKLAPVAGGSGYAWVQAVGFAMTEDIFYVDPSMDIIIRKP